MESRQFVVANFVLGTLTAVSNGGAAVMMLGDSSHWSSAQIGEAVLLASIGFYLAAIGGLAIVGRISLSRALNWQAWALAGLLVILILWGLVVLLDQASKQNTVSWVVGILLGLAIYLFYLFRHAVDAGRFKSFRPILLGLCILATVVDVGMFARVGWF